MTVHIRTVRYKNFLSTGNAWTEIVIDNPLTGINGRNGHGKSSFLDAVSFSLYNKPFRKINKPQLVNSINGRECLVEIEFEAGGALYLVRRGIKPNIFEIEKSGVLIDQSAANLDYQEVLESQILKMNHRTFCQIAILGSANFVPFMQLSASQRREVVEDLLDIQIFSKMNSVLKQHVQTNKDGITALRSKIDQHKSNIAIHEKHLARLLIDSGDRAKLAEAHYNDAKERLDAAEAELAAFDLPCDDVSDAIDAKKKLSTELSLLQRRIVSKVDSLDKVVAFYTDHSNCPTCHQEISEEFTKQKIASARAEKDEVEEAQRKLNTKTSVVQKELESLQETQNDHKKAVATYTRMAAAVDGLRAEVLRAFDALEHANDGGSSTKEEIQKEVAGLTDKLAQCEEVLSALMRKQERLNVASVLLKDGGIKARIIRQYIPVINKLINKYLASMDFYVQFEFDENFTETIRSKYREDFSYASFSEGEKARINIALLFAWRAIAKMRNSASTNLLILDEVFDGALDSVGSDELMGILEQFTQGTNAFVISHREGLIEKFPNSIRFEKRGNFSQMV